MKRIHAIKLLITVGFITGLLMSGYVAATSLSEAKSAGWICEQTSGYLRVASAKAPGDIQGMVDSINNQRTAEYGRIAKKNGVSVDQVARLAAQKVIGAAPQFQCK